MTPDATMTYRWTAHPARQHRGKAACAGGAIVMLAMGVHVAAGPGLWALPAALAAAIAITLSLNRFFFPSRFTIDDEGITGRYPLRTLRRHWADLHRFVTDRHGGFLSTRPRPSRLDVFSGMHLLFGVDREAAVQRIREHLREGSS